jgi:hypothetical protein
MSDVSQGPGWWQASDAKWYPPESHPAAAGQAPTAAAGQAPTAAAGQAPTAGQPLPVGTPAPADAAAEPPAAVATAHRRPSPWELAPSHFRDKHRRMEAGKQLFPDSSFGLPPDGSSVAPPRVRPLSGRRAAKTIVLIVVLCAIAGGVVYYFHWKQGSAGGVASAVVQDYNQGEYNQACSYSSNKTDCLLRAAFMAKTTVAHNLSVEYVAHRGNRAVALVTGRVCIKTSGTCTNYTQTTFPYAWGFTTEWVRAMGATTSSRLMIPLEYQNGKWVTDATAK